jgi:hypothetical protein
LTLLSGIQTSGAESNGHARADPEGPKRRKRLESEIFLKGLLNHHSQGWQTLQREMYGSEMGTLGPGNAGTATDAVVAARDRPGRER